MAAYIKTWALAYETKSNSDGLNLLSRDRFTRQKAESLRDKLNAWNPAKPVYVVNLNAE
jgi:hypothetical protein